MGPRQVVQALDVSSGASVCIAAVECAADGMATASLAREIGALESLAHQSAVLPLLDSGRAAGWLYMVTPWIEVSLADAIQRDGKMPVESAVANAIAIADLLHFAHSIGIVHGSISAASIAFIDQQPVLGGFQRTGRVLDDAAGRRAVSADVFALACTLFESLTGTPWRVGSPMPGEIPDELTLLLHRALGGNQEARFSSAIAFAQAVCGVRDNALVAEDEVTARDAFDLELLEELPLSEGADRSLRVLHALLDRAEVADHAPEPDDPLVQRCWERAEQQVAHDDARLVALQCRWRLLADRDPIGALGVTHHAPYAAAVLPYRARALAALGRAAEARSLAVRAWFDDVAMDLSALRSLTMALLLTRAFDLASLVSVAERAKGVVDPVILAAGQVAVAHGTAKSLSPAAQSRALRAIAAAIEQRAPWTVELLVDPRWDGLRSDHRFSVLVGRTQAAWTS